MKGFTPFNSGTSYINGPSPLKDAKDAVADVKDKLKEVKLPEFVKKPTVKKPSLGPKNKKPSTKKVTKTKVTKPTKTTTSNKYNTTPTKETKTTKTTTSDKYNTTKSKETTVNNKKSTVSQKKDPIIKQNTTPPNTSNATTINEKKSWLDNVQTGLSAAGLTPGIGLVPDAANTLISGARAGYAKLTGGDTAEHLKNMAINAGSMVPGVGQAVATTGLAADIIDRAGGSGKKQYASKGLPKPGKV